ncbi:HK97 family phage prohead protease [Dialister invisus]|uniref:HK97 family phage prohead protease n=1 Tax=Dialister invisus TaxID=218538 RepID=UPI003AAD450B
MSKKILDKKQAIMRSFTFADLRAKPLTRDDGQDDSIRILEGHASVFGQDTDIGGYFTERISKGAFDDCDFTDVPFFANHDIGRIPMARSRRNNGNSTMTLSIDDVGLKIEAKIDTKGNPDSAALYSAIERGDITGMSFMFTVGSDEWDFTDEDHPIRTIHKIKKVYEVSAVNWPAYDGTDISGRDKDAVDTAKKAVETARAQALDNATEKEKIKIRNRILGGI